MSLVVVGSVAFDAIETPFGKIDKVIGGAATFISLAASYFVKPVQLVAVIGRDFPEETINDFISRGIDVSGLERDLNQDSFFWSGKYRADMNTRDTIETRLNVLADFKPVLPRSYRDAEYLMLGNLTPDIQKSVIDQMVRKPKFVALDTMNFWMNPPFVDQLIENLELIDLLTINDEEARLISGEYSLVKAAKKILEKGPRFLVIKKGEHGALLFHENKIFVAPALPLEEVFDPTGAGDTFAGGLMGYLARTENITFDNLKNAVIYGTTMASFCVEKFGPQRLLELTVDKIRLRYDAIAALSSYERALF